MDSHNGNYYQYVVFHARLSIAMHSIIKSSLILSSVLREASMLPTAISLLALLQLSSAVPLLPSIFTSPAEVLEWTALGDSYASGVGAGDYGSDSYRCMRYDQAYPVQLSKEPDLGLGGD
jgi:hypothetical protein